MRVLQLLIILFSNLFFLGHTAFSQNYYFNHITKAYGMASNRVLCIKQDKSGFMWFGTDEGLNRFDGSHIEVFRHNPDNPFSISHDNIVCISEDTTTGDMWIGTYKGLNYYNKAENKFHRNFKLPRNNNDLLKSKIVSLLVDSKRNTWIGTYNGLYVYFHHSDTPVTYKRNHLPKCAINCIFEDSKQNIWIGTNTGLELFDPSTKKFIKLVSFVSNVLSIYEDSKKNLWVSTSTEGIYVIRNKTSVNFSKDFELLHKNKIFSITEDHHGNFLFGAQDGIGLFLLNLKSRRLTQILNDKHSPSSISSNALTSMFRDNIGNIWIGTFNNGINMIDRYQKPFNHYKANFKPDGLLSNNIRSAFQDSDGDIWIGTKEDGCLSRFNPLTGTFIHYTASKGLKSTDIFSIAEAKPGLLLIGTYKNGLSLFDKHNKRFYHYTNNPKDNKSVATNDIYSIFKDRFDTIWIASSKLQKFDLTTRTFNTLEGITNVKCFLDYNSDEIYFGTIKGLVSYNRRSKKITRYLPQPGDTTSISDESINGLVKDHLGNIWIATHRGGLCYFDTNTKRFRTYTTHNGLPSNYVRSVLMDSSGNLWMGTANGLSKFEPATQTFRNYYVCDGLQGDEFERYVGLKTREGFMFFGGSNGFNYFNPDNIIENPVVPKVAITNFKIFNKQVTINDKNSPLHKQIMFTNNLVLTYKQSSISFDFVAINYSSPCNNQYAYILEGLETEWNNAGNKRSASYTNLSPGTYTFKVIASNNDGKWNKQGVTLKLTVTPPWWREWWFTALLFLAAVGATIGYIRYRTRKLRHEKQKLEQMVNERTQNIELQKQQIALQRDQLAQLNNKVTKISKMRVQFFTNISHEFRTPLSLIIAPVNKLLSMNINDNEILQQLHLVRRNTTRLQGLINELMDFRSIETQNLKLSLTQTNIVKFIAEIAECFNELAKQRELNYVFESKNQYIEVLFDVVILEKILYNLLSNAFKYTPDKGLIKISIHSGNPLINKSDIIIGKLVAGNNYIEISVKDTGTGISPENLQHIFKEFYREQSASTINGTGIGLSLTKELVRIHKGCLTVQSKKNTGSVFTVYIPADRHNYEKVEINQQAYDLTFSKTQLRNFLASQPAANTNSLPLADQIPKTHAKQTVLIVEDNDDLRSFLVSELSLEYNVIQATNGQDGLKLATKKAPDMIISDILMPKINGIELCKALKDDIQTCHIPVILLTALSGPDNEISGFNSGADEYMPKPFDITVLKARIQNLIQSRNKLRQIFNSSVIVAPDQVTTNPNDERFLKKALEIINENMPDPEFGAKELVDKMGMSKSALHQKLINLTNQSALEFITTIRLKKAAQLMQTQGHNVTDIAVMVGYSDPSYFGRCFKKQFGQSPKAYLEAITNK